MKKINAKLISIQCIFLVIVVGGSILLYSLLGPYFYRNHRVSVLTMAYENIKDIDLSNIGEDISVFQEYEGSNFRFIIADENMNSVYTTDKASQSSIHKNIELRLGEYSNNPAIVRRKSSNGETIRLCVVIPQGERDYYVCIRDKMNSADIPFQFTVIMLDAVFLLAVTIGSLVMYSMSSRLVAPIKQLEKVAQSIASRDFSQRAEEKGKFEELNHLAISINSMSEQIQEYVKSMEENKKKLMQQRMQQEHLDKARKDFISNVSHELKTPLAVVSSQVEMLQFLKDDERREYYYASIQEEVAKMSEMVANLLDMTVIEHNIGKLKKKEFSMNETIAYILLKYDALFQTKNIQLETQLAEDCRTYGDREYIEQAINNFVMNALQHTQQGDVIRVTMEKEQQNLTVRVFNQGEPISRKDIDKVWASFYMAEKEKEKEEENGLGHTGLGLYIVKTVMEMHGGTYGVENVENGVEFWFSVPNVK